ncbi:MAG: four-carbon acid sugar kinase family protein [Bryobacteraceae bacterium]
MGERSAITTKAVATAFRSSPSVLVLADDMTGALEVGARFSAAGIGAVVSTKVLHSSTAQVIVYDTETRHVSPADAAEVIHRLIGAAISCSDGTMPFSAVYKKTDSTLRGNIATELKALSDLFPDWRIGYAPAYPSQGRTVRGGVLYVDGIEVAQSSFGRDLLSPVSVSDIRSMLAGEFDCTIFNGELDSHVDEAAHTILSDPSMRILAGPAALAGAYANLLAQKPASERMASAPLPAISSCLVMNGSRHERSIAQMRHRQMPAGWKLIEMSHEPGAEPDHVAQANAEFLLKKIADCDPDAVFVMGGATVYALIAALGHPTLWPIHEIVHGVPIARVDRAETNVVLPQRTRDLFLISKAGGFGELDVLQSVHSALTHHGA